MQRVTYLLLAAASFWENSPTAVVAFTATTTTTTVRTSTSSRCDRAPLFQLFNVPPPAETDVEKFQEYASNIQPPASFFDLQKDCIRSARMAVDDDLKLLEIEFPPLPAETLEMTDVGTYQVVNANLQLALEFSKGLIQATTDNENSKPIKKIAIMCPDEAETQLCIEYAGGSENPLPGVVISSLLRDDPDDERRFKPEQVLLNLFGQRSGVVNTIEDADLYIILTASAQELPDIEELHQAQPDVPVIFYNLKLDVLRGDLGAPAFPPKELHDRFLSKIKPIYYIRSRQYTRSTATPPFLINFQGCLFRSYPGDYQTLLDTGTNKYRRVLGTGNRPGLGEFKQQLTDELQRVGVLEDEGKTIGFLRTGYKTTTWWEDEREGASRLWRT